MNFDRIAPFYDASAQLVFGNEHRRAEACFLDFVPEGARVLLVGGGTGKLLETLLQTRRPSAVVFLEASTAMRNRAMKRVSTLADSRCVRFVGALEEAPPLYFNVLITPYFLDMFSDVQLESQILPPLLKTLEPETQWLFTDFVSSAKARQRFLLRTMYWFFRVVCGIPARKLPDYATHFKRWQFNPTERKSFFGGMIEATLLRRGTPNVALP